MRKRTSVVFVFLALACGAAGFTGARGAVAADRAEIEATADSALRALYQKYPTAELLAQHAKGILIFPKIVKGGFIVGGLYGEGVLRMGSKTVGYYNTVAASYGLQAGLQKYGYVLFFMTDAALGYLERSDGWEVGIGPSIVVVDEGLAKSLTTTTARDDVYAFIFGQKGLMAGIGLQGSKITRIHKSSSSIR
uniref:Twin-arginine translocation pathway signal protein n=1 Tax=Desulfacinum infernum TaxID=35837 RepID=A0A832EAC1_9BACT